MNNKNSENSEKKQTNMIGSGLAIGSAMGNPGAGLAIGIALGISVGAAIQNKKKTE
jgi:F0F1-type ATP synthase membrane subunit c/vacuolar-type H+-ATPase subunit K